MEIPSVRFPHQFVGHRYLAVGGIGGGPAGGGTGAGSEGGGAGAEGAAGPAGVGAVGAVISSIVSQAAFVPPIAAIVAGQPTPAAPTLVIPTAPLTLPSPQAELVRAATMGSQRGGPPAPPATVSDTVLRGPGPQPFGLPSARSITVRQQGGRPPTAPPPFTPPGPQGGPDNVPTLTLEQRQGCTTCGQISRDIETLKTSIQTERSQQQEQTLQQQESQIESYQQQESGQQPQQAPLDRQIADKIALLQELENELAQAQAGAGGGFPSSPPSLPPSQPGQVVPTVQQAPSFGDFLKSIGEEAGCAKILSTLGIPAPAAFAICAGVQALVGDTKKLEQYARKLYDALTSPGGQGGGRGVPTVISTPPPPLPTPAIRMCMICESAEDAVRWQAGEPTSGCAVESVREANPEDFANRG